MCDSPKFCLICGRHPPPTHRQHTGWWVSVGTPLRGLAAARADRREAQGAGPFLKAKGTPPSGGGGMKRSSQSQPFSIQGISIFFPDPYDFTRARWGGGEMEGCQPTSASIFLSCRFPEGGAGSKQDLGKVGWRSWMPSSSRRGGRPPTQPSPRPHVGTVTTLTLWWYITHCCSYLCWYIPHVV